MRYKVAMTYTDSAYVEYNFTNFNDAYACVKIARSDGKLWDVSMYDENGDRVDCPHNLR